MRILDINVALDERKPSNGELVTEQMLYQYMDTYRITHCVAYNRTALSDPMHGNGKMLQTAKESHGRIGACLVLDPILMEDSIPGEGSLSQRLTQCDPEAVRLCPDNAGLLFHKFYWKAILDQLKDTNIPVIVDCAYTPLFFAHLPDVLAAYPRINFVLLRCGFKKQRMIDPLLRAFSNLYIDMSIMIDSCQLAEIYEIDQCKRLVFGSGYPKFDPTGAYGLVIYGGIPQEARQAIFSGNWERVHK